MKPLTINIIYYSILFLIFALIDILQGKEVMWITNMIFVIVAVIATYFLEAWTDRDA